MAEGRVLSGRRIVVTGATRGFGYAMVRAFLVAGARVALCGRSWESVEHALGRLPVDLCLVPEGEAPSLEVCPLGGREGGGSASSALAHPPLAVLDGRLLGLPCDTRSWDQMQALGWAVEEVFGGFDVWVNNAGISGPFGEVETIPREEYEDVVQTNILGTYYGTLVALGHFLPKRSGKIINVTGMGADGRVAPFQSAYAPTKAWVQSFTRGVAAEHEGSGVGIYALSPGMMVTDMMTDVEVTSDVAEHRLEAFPGVLAALGETPDVPARLAVELASSASDGKTGLVVKALGRPQMARKGLSLLARRITGRAGPTVPVQVRRRRSG